MDPKLIQRTVLGSLTVWAYSNGLQFIHPRETFPQDSKLGGILKSASVMTYQMKNGATGATGIQGQSSNQMGLTIIQLGVSAHGNGSAGITPIALKMGQG